MHESVDQTFMCVWYVIENKMREKYAKCVKVGTSDIGVAQIRAALILGIKCPPSH